MPASGQRCIVGRCKNVVKTKDPSKPFIMFHRFPKNPELREIWMQSCKKAVNPNKHRICAAHFTENDYERDFQAELLGTPRRKVLKKTAVPTIKVPRKKPNTILLGCEYEPDYLLMKQEEKEDSDAESEPQTDDPYKEYQEIVKKYEELEKQYSHMKYQNLILQEALKSCQTDLEIKDVSFSKLNIELHRVKKAKLSDKVIKKKAREMLLNVFTKNQITILLKEKKKVNWSWEEMSKAMTLFCLSKKAYLFLRQKCHFPIPGLSTLHRWVSDSKLLPKGERIILTGLLDHLRQDEEVEGVEGEEELEEDYELEDDEVKRLEDEEVEGEVDEENDEVVEVRGTEDEEVQGVEDEVVEVTGRDYEEKVDEEVVEVRGIEEEDDEVVKVRRIEDEELEEDDEMEKEDEELVVLELEEKGSHSNGGNLVSKTFAVC